jgi:catechol 2,3-dioxygenase-like lactoylglutathione lyase family enzyme
VITCAAPLRLCIAILLFAVARPASAQDFWRQRPKVQVAVGLGASVDDNAPNPHPGRPLSAFFFAVGIGDGLVGLELRSFANGATNMQMGRLSGELVGVVRPLARVAREGYGFRVLRTAAADVGPGVERDSLALDSDWRAGVSLGAHADLPIGPAGAAKELRLRLGVRRLVATRGSVGGIPVKDSTVELYGQVAFVF